MGNSYFVAANDKTMKHDFYLDYLFVTAGNLLPFTFDVLRSIFHQVEIEFLFSFNFKQKLQKKDI